MGVLSLTGAGMSSLPIVSRGTRGCAREPAAGGVEFSVLSLGDATERLKAAMCVDTAETSLTLHARHSPTAPRCVAFCGEGWAT